MPIYEYRCPNGHTFEVFQRMTDDPLAVCEVCGEGPVEKVLFPVAVHFKGSGFYSTDYGRSRKTAREGEGGSSSSDGKAPETAKESKPAAASGESASKPAAD